MSAQEQTQPLACVLCGTHKGSKYFYHDSKDKSLYLCRDCLRSLTLSVTRDQIKVMTVAQAKRHMEVREELAATYRDSFVATKKFCIGKKRNIPVIVVDEERGLWAIPNASMPLAQSLSSIVDVSVVLDSEELDDGSELEGEVVEGLQLKDLWPLLRSFINSLYKSKHTDLAPIPDGHFVNYLTMVLTLDDRESGLSRIDINLLPFWLSLPSRVDAGYDCAYNLITYLKQRASTAYEQQKELRERLHLTGNELLSDLIASGQVATRDLEIIGYYLDQLPAQSKAKTSSPSSDLVRTAVETVSTNIMQGEKVPDWKTQHTTSIETFLGAFYRYAPGLCVSDVVYIMDNTKLQFGRKGMLLAQECFAVDDFTSNPKKPSDPDQPIAYDDLLFVGTGEGKGELVLVYKDGRRIEVSGGAYAHYLFAVVNSILCLRASSKSADDNSKNRMA